MQDVALECTEYNGTVSLHRERMIHYREPERLAHRKYYPALNAGRELRWVDKSKPEQLMSNGDVVESVIEQLLSLVDRVNHGEIPPIRDYDD
jgi:hypothetical protein